MRGLFVTATDTGVGKTVVCAALVAAIAADGEPVRAYKPAITGLQDDAEIAARGAWPPDHELLAAVSGMDPDEVSPLRYGPAVSPHLAAERSGARIDRGRLIEHARDLAGPAEDRRTLIVEGIGGLLVPFAEDYSVRDLAVDLGLPVVVVARPGLGTINHTLLTVEAARSAGLDVAAVVMTPWAASPDAIARSNREAVAALGDVDVHTLERLDGLEPGALARAGAALPFNRWLRTC